MNDTTAAQDIEVRSPEDTPHGIDLNGTTVIRVQGSACEPYLSHGQPTVAIPARRVQGEDLYVYYDHAQEAHLIAWMDRAADRVTIETATRETTYRPEPEPDTWRRPDGRTERFRVVGRVVGALKSVGKQRAAQREMLQLIADAPERDA